MFNTIELVSNEEYNRRMFMENTLAGVILSYWLDKEERENASLDAASL